MIPSHMELRIKTGTVGYNNKILVSDGNFSLGKNGNVNSLETPAIKTNSLELTQAPTISHEDEKPKITHSDCSGTDSGRWFCNMEYVQMKSQ